MIHHNNAVVSDDDDDNSRIRGTMILDGEEESKSNELEATGIILSNDVSLNESSLESIVQNVSWRIGSKLIPPSDVDSDNEEEEKVAVCLFDTTARRRRFQKKNVVILVASVMILILGIIGVQQWRRQQQLIADLQRQAQEWQQERALLLKKQKPFDGDEPWRVADNCYYRVDLGDCAVKRMEELNDLATSVWDGIGEAWKSATSWPEEEEEETAESIQQSISDEAQAAMAATVHSVSKAVEAVTHGVASFVTDMTEHMNEKLQRVRDAVEESTKHTRLEGTYEQ